MVTLKLAEGGNLFANERIDAMATCRWSRVVVALSDKGFVWHG
jgi:hypothetical protein